MFRTSKEPAGIGSYPTTVNRRDAGRDPVHSHLFAVDALVGLLVTDQLSEFASDRDPSYRLDPLETDFKMDLHHLIERDGACAAARALEDIEERLGVLGRVARLRVGTREAKIKSSVSVAVGSAGD